MEESVLRLALLFLCHSLSFSYQFERILYRKLLDGYEPLARPVDNYSTPVKVKMGLLLQQIIDVDEKNQIMETNIWQQLQWNDYRLKWDPVLFGGVTDLRFPVGKIWKPDVLLYNSVDRNFDSTYPSNMVVDHEGNVDWIPPSIVRTSCNIDITWFPFDDQVCYFKFGSWSYNNAKLDLQIHERALDTSEYMQNGEWLLLETPTVRQDKAYAGPEDVYSALFFYVKIRRRTLYYGFNMIVPSLVISCMTLLGFGLPVESGEKITMEITILLSVCVFSTMIQGIVPPTSEAVPLIGTFFTCHMFAVAASCVFNVVVLNLYYRSGREDVSMPDWVRSLLLHWLPWLLLMKRPDKDSRTPREGCCGWSMCKKRSVSAEANGYRYPVSLDDVTSFSPILSKGSSGSQRKRSLSSFKSEIWRRQSSPQLLHGHVYEVGSLKQAADRCSNNRGHLTNCTCPNRTQTPLMTDGSVMALLVSLREIQGSLEYFLHRMESKDEAETARNDWKFAAAVIDRLCLIVFAGFIIVTTCSVLFSAPHLVA